MDGDLGVRFAQALGAKDAAALRVVLRPDVDFRALTPNAFWESKDATDLVERILLGQWFEPSDEITDVEVLETAPVGPRQRVAYRFRVTNPDGQHLVEQQAYFEADGDRIGWLRVMCAGFLPAD